MAASFITKQIERIKSRINEGRYSSELNKIEKLIQEGNFDEALKKEEAIESKEDLPKKTRLKLQALKSQLLIEKGEFESGLKLADKLFEESKEIREHLLMIDALVSRVSALCGLGKLNECLEAVEKCENLIKSQEHFKQKDLIPREAALNRLKGKYHQRKGDLNLSLENYQLALSSREKLKNEPEIASLLNDIGVTHASKGEFDLALEFLQKSLKIYDKLGIERLTVKIFNNIGLIYAYKGELDRALEFYQNSLKLSEKYGVKQVAATLLLNMGHIYLNKGDFDLALDYFQSSLTQYEELDSKFEIAVCLSNMGNIFERKGDLSDALEAYTRSLELYEELGNKPRTGVMFNNIGNVFLTRGDVDEATSYYKKSLELLEATENNRESSLVLYNLISVAVHWGNVEDANFYLEKLQQINEKEKEKAIDQVYRLSNALVLKKSSRVVKRAEAQQIFQQIAEEEVITHSFTVDAMLYLCEMLLQELRTTGSEGVLTEIKEILQKILDIAESQHSFSRLVETYMLQSKMALLELDINSTRQLLSQAQQIAEEKGLQKLAMTVSGEYDLLLDQLSKWTDLIDQNVPMIEKLELAELEGMVTRIVRKKAEVPEFTEEEPALFLILSNVGELKYSKQFVSEEILDDKVIGDLMTAINNFVQEAFSATGSIERVKHKEHTLLLKPINPFLCCYVFKGQSYSALQKLDEFIGFMKESRALWNLVTAPIEIEISTSDKQEIDELVNEIFLAPE
ncbi:MAG: tetratricopeptide repeat protein [Candidatus Hodarchaeota archaeon]